MVHSLGNTPYRAKRVAIMDLHFNQELKLFVSRALYSKVETAAVFEMMDLQMWKKPALIGLLFGLAMAVSVPVIGALLSVFVKILSFSVGYDLEPFASLPMYISLSPAVEETVRSILILYLVKHAINDAGLHLKVTSLGLSFGAFEMVQKIYWRDADGRQLAIYDLGWMIVAVGSHVAFSLLFLSMLRRFNFVFALMATMAVHYFYNFLVVAFT